MVDMLQQHVIPAVKESGMGPLSELVAATEQLKEGLLGLQVDMLPHPATLTHEMGTAAAATVLAARKQDESPAYIAASRARVLRLETMVEVRRLMDAAEAVVPAHMWNLSTYSELLFLDQTFDM
jgi:glutamine synthetase